MKKNMLNLESKDMALLLSEIFNIDQSDYTVLQFKKSGGSKCDNYIPVYSYAFKYDLLITGVYCLEVKIEEYTNHEMCELYIRKNTGNGEEFDVTYAKLPIDYFVKRGLCVCEEEPCVEIN